MRLDHGYPTEISLEGRLLSKKRKMLPPEIHEFEVDGARFKVTFTLTVNLFRNMGVKCRVERNGELIADDPDQAAAYPRAVMNQILVGTLLGFGTVALLVLLRVLYLNLFG